MQEKIISNVDLSSAKITSKTDDQVKIVKSSELPDLAQQLPEETVVRVSDELFQPYILLKDKDDNPYWRRYNWAPIEQVRQWHKFEIEADKIFGDKKRDQEDLDFLRELFTATSLVVNFYELGEETHQELTAGAIAKIAVLWMKKDLKTENLTDEQMSQHYEVYANLVVRYIQLLVSTMMSAKIMTEQASEAIK